MFEMMIDSKGKTLCMKSCLLILGLALWIIGCSDSGSASGLDGGDGWDGQDAAADTDFAVDGGAGDGVDGVDDVDGGSGTEWTRPMCVWNQAYQENYQADTVAEILANARHCYVLIDPFDSEEARDAIAQMKTGENVVGCYISVGTCEDWREDFDAIKDYCVSKAWDEWGGEYFVDRTDTGLVGLMALRMDKMADWGCDMVEFDNMDWAFDDDYRSEYGFHVTEEQARAYNQALCHKARDKGMMCMAKSTTEGAEDFDGLTVESYPDNKDWWDTDDMQDILHTGKLGIVVHYDETDCAAVYGGYKAKYGDELSFICEDRNQEKYVHFNR